MAVKFKLSTVKKYRHSLFNVVPIVKDTIFCIKIFFKIVFILSVLITKNKPPLNPHPTPNKNQQRDARKDLEVLGGFITLIAVTVSWM